MFCIFEVCIEDRNYNVYSIEDKEHDGEYPNWWVKYGDKFIPYNPQINRRVWDIRVKGYTTSDTKYGEIMWSSGYKVTMLCNNREIYKFSANDLSYAFSRANVLTVELVEHPYNFLVTEKEEGRKIYYHGLPATVKPERWGNISVIPDLSNGKYCSTTWWEAYTRRVTENVSKEDLYLDLSRINEHKSYGMINHGDPLSDGYINWFRDE